MPKYTPPMEVPQPLGGREVPPAGPAAARRWLIDLPDLWDPVDLSGEQLARTRAEALAQVSQAREKARINDMFRQGREVLRSARKQGALLAAGTATQYDDGLFMAYGMVFAVTTPEGQELTLPVLSRQLGLTREGVAPPDRQIIPAQIPAVGTVARVTGTETTRLTADVDAKLLTMHTMIPVPGRAGDYLVVTLASPNLPLKDAAYDLFDAITSSFRFI